MPYSDNLYSIDDEGSDSEPIDASSSQSLGTGLETRGWQEDAEGDDHLYSPTDGYFHSTSSAAHDPNWDSSASGPTSTASPTARIPHVPDVWVRDPSLAPGSTAESKAREARAEALGNYPSVDTSGSTYHGAPDAGTQARSANDYVSSPHQYTASSSSGATHYQPSAVAYTPFTSAAPYTPLSSRRQAAYNHPSPFIPGEAPPAYTPSSSSNTSPSSVPAATLQTSPTSHSPGNYNTFRHPSAMGREEARGLLAEDPESMGNPDDEYINVVPVWRERVKRRIPWLSRRACGMFLLALVLVGVLLGFLISGIASVKKDATKVPVVDNPSVGQPVNEQPPVDNKPSDGNPSDGNPSNGNPSDGNPSHGDPSTGKPIPVIGRPSDGSDPWQSDKSCGDGQVGLPSYSFDLAFGDGNNLTFLQNIKKDDDTRGRGIKVSGDLTIRQSGEGNPGPSVVVDVAANFEGVEPSVQFYSESQVLSINVPRAVPWGDAHTRPCLRIYATIWVPKDAALDTLYAENVHLGIKLRDDLSLRVNRATALTTVVGDVTAAVDDVGQTSPLDGGAPAGYKFDSRWIEVKSTSAAIHGHWPLYDYLRLQTTSGNIRAGINPQTVNEDAPKPALLYVKSLSGNVEFYEPTSKAVTAQSPGQYIPPRDYRSDVYTTSGDIKAALAFSRVCQVHSTSGLLDIDALPVLDTSFADSGEAATLETSSTSGRAIIRVPTPLWTEGSLKRYLSPAGQARAQTRRVLRTMRGRHSSTSANIKLYYPPSWEGDFDFSSMTGKLGAHGENVKVIREGSDWPGVNKKMLARKGPEGGSYVEARSTSGDIDATVS